MLRKCEEISGWSWLRCRMLYNVAGDSNGYTTKHISLLDSYLFWHSQLPNPRYGPVYEPIQE